jgi:hypothetical protein
MLNFMALLTQADFAVIDLFAVPLAETERSGEFDVFGLAAEKSGVRVGQGFGDGFHAGGGAQPVAAAHAMVQFKHPGPLWVQVYDAGGDGPLRGAAV